MRWNNTPIPTSKVCLGCGQLKALDEYPPAQSPRDKRRPRCRPCDSLFNKKYNKGGNPWKEPQPVEERFWSKVNRKGEDDCWPWTGGRTPSDYGRFAIKQNGKWCMEEAHRISYALANPDEDISQKVIRHRCDNPPCQNPKHLLSGTHADNAADAKQRGRLSVGDRHYSRQRPEAIQRGENHWSHRHPEWVSQGEKNGTAKLTAAQVKEMRQLYATGQYIYDDLALIYGINRGACHAAVTKITWKHLE